MLTDSLKPPLILHSYDPANEDVKFKNFRPCVPEFSLEEHAPTYALLQVSNRSCVMSECQVGLLILSSHL